MKLKWCQDHSEQIKIDILGCHHSIKKFGSFWKQINEKYPRSSLFVNVTGESDTYKIAELYNIQFKVDSQIGQSKEPPFDGIGTDQPGVSDL